MSHTKGPWEVREKRLREFSIGGGGLWEFSIGGGGLWPIATVGQAYSAYDKDGISRGISHNTIEANAKLIAAAPDLLMMLKLARDDLEASGYAFDHPMLVRCDSAIAKATGADSEKEKEKGLR